MLKAEEERLLSYERSVLSSKYFTGQIQFELKIYLKSSNSAVFNDNYLKILMMIALKTTLGKDPHHRQCPA